MNSIKITSLLYLLLFVLINNYSKAQSWVWAKNTGSTNSIEEASFVKTDASGNIYVAGIFNGATVAFGTFTLSNAATSGTQDIFLVKYNSAGTVLWAYRAGGTTDEKISGLDLDPAGNILITGNFNSNAITFGSTTLTRYGAYNDIFTAKFDLNGNVLWAKRIGGPDDDKSYSLCTDASSNVYIVGAYSSYTLAAGSFSLANCTPSTPTDDGFIIKYNSAGNTAWVQSIGNTTYEKENVQTVVSDVAGTNIYVVGSIQGSATIGTATLTTSDNINRDLFFAKYNASTGVPVFANLIPGDGLEYASGMTRDASNNIYFTGSYDGGSMTFGGTTINNTSATTYDIYLAKYNTSGVTQWVKSQGNSSVDESSNLCTDASGNIFIAGTFKSNNITFGTTTLTNASPNTYYDAFFTKYNSAGTVLLAQRVGGTNTDYANAIAVDGSNNLYLVGAYASTSINFGAITLTNSVLYDAFVAKYGTITTGISATEQNNTILIYPNPTSGKINIKIEESEFLNFDSNTEITITNYLGETLLSRELSSNILDFNLNNFAAGIYIVQIQNVNGETLTRKIIKN